MSGSARPIRLLLVHGSRLNAAAWLPLEEALLGRIVCDHVDLPGHGTRSDVPFTMEAALEVVGAGVADLDPSQHRVVVAGHSLGEGHEHVFGANLGIRGSLFTRIGGEFVEGIAGRTRRVDAEVGVIVRSHRLQDVDAGIEDRTL